MSSGQQRIARAAAAAVTAAAVGIMTAGCSSGGLTPVAHGSGSSTPKATGSTPASSAVLNGPQLANLLPSPAQLPSGWTWGAGGSVARSNSGSPLHHPPYLQVLSHNSCKKLNGVDPQFLISDDSAATATLDTNVSQGKNSATGQINVASYQPGWAAKEWADITAFAFKHCAAFTTRDPITRAMVKEAPKVRTMAGVGDQAILIDIEQTNGPLPANGPSLKGTYYPGDYLLVTRVGNYIADANAPAVPVVSQAHNIDSIIARLVGKLRAIG